MVSICEADDAPGYSTVMRWLASDAPQFKAFRDNYARARDAQAERFAQQIISIADDATPETVGVDKLRIDARKWTAANLLPKKYGTQRQEHSGPDGGPIPVARIERVNAPPAADD